MSHAVKSEETTMLSEHEDCVEKALRESFPGAEILKDTATSLRGRGLTGAFVVRRKGHNDIVLVKEEDGSYTTHTYEPGYGSGRTRINNLMRSARIRYRELTSDKFAATMNMRRQGAAKATQVKMPGEDKERTMMCITLRGGAKTSKKNKGKVMY